MISSVAFNDFKIWRALDMKLGRLTVLVGPNSSGKTSVLEGVQLLTRLGNNSFGQLLQDRRAPQNLVRRGASMATLKLLGTWAEETGSVELTATRQSRPLPPPQEHEETFPIEVNARLGAAAYASRNPEDVLWNAIPTLATEISRSAFLRLEPGRLAAASYSDRDVPRLESDGEGLASVVGFLALNQPEHFEALKARLRAIVPSVERLRVGRARVTRAGQAYMGEELLFDMKGAAGVPAHATSEGTLLALGFLAVLMGPSRPHVVLLDDLDRGLHPAAQKTLVDVLRELIRTTPELQIVATSHSPYLLDHLHHDEVRLTTLRDDGTPVLGSLLEHPDFERWKQLMTPGELWSSVGEHWLTQRPDQASH